MRVAPCCWALVRRGDIFDPDVPELSGRETVNAEHRGEVASLSGPAAAVDEYEDAPHGVITVR
jgi:hypothetical protein